MKFLGYNNETRDVKVFECSTPEFRGWVNAVLRDTHYNIVIVSIKKILYVLEIVNRFDPTVEKVNTSTVEYTRTSVKYHPLADRLELPTDVFLSKNIRLQKENKAKAKTLNRV